MAKKMNTASLVREAIEPIAVEQGLMLWDVRFEKEGPEWFLRAFIDKEGGVGLDDCEKFSRAIDPILDQLDPTEHSYFLEVSSPGIGRTLTNDKHLDAYIEKEVELKLIRPDNEGKKEFFGMLKGYDDKEISTEIDGQTKAFDKKALAYIKASEQDLFGGKK